METDEYKALNYVRSFVEAIGAPVIQLPSIDLMPIHLTDMHLDEVNGYKHVWEVLNGLGQQPVLRNCTAADQYLLRMKGALDATSQDRQRSNDVGSTAPALALA
jgi:hypothetical protein